MSNQRIKKNLLEKFKEQSSHDKLPRKQSEVTKLKELEIQDDYVPIVNNFSFLKKGDGLGRNLLQPKRSSIMNQNFTNTTPNSNFDNLNILYRTFNNQIDKSYETTPLAATSSTKMVPRANARSQLAYTQKLQQARQGGNVVGQWAEGGRVSSTNNNSMERRLQNDAKKEFMTSTGITAARTMQSSLNGQSSPFMMHSGP